MVNALHTGAVSYTPLDVYKRQDLGGGDILVGQHFGDGVDVCSHGELEYRIGVSEAVEGNMFGDTSCLNPPL